MEALQNDGGLYHFEAMYRSGVIFIECSYYDEEAYKYGLESIKDGSLWDIYSFFVINNIDPDAEISPYSNETDSNNIAVCRDSQIKSVADAAALLTKGEYPEIVHLVKQKYEEAKEESHSM